MEEVGRGKYMGGGMKVGGESGGGRRGREEGASTLHVASVPGWHIALAGSRPAM